MNSKNMIDRNAPYVVILGNIIISGKAMNTKGVVKHGGLLFYRT